MNRRFSSKTLTSALHFSIRHVRISLNCATGLSRCSRPTPMGTARSSPAISAVSRPAVGVAECLDVSPSDSSQAIFACGAGGRFRLLSDARLHNRVAASRKGRGSRPESPSTEDACLRCWLNSDSPVGDGAARHWGRSHRTLVSARARDETPRRTADSFGGSVPKGEQGLRRMLYGQSGRGQSCLSRVLTAESTTCRSHHRSCESCCPG